MSNYKLDEQKLIGAYDQILEEGLFDRLKARGSQAMGAVQGAGQQLKGTLKQKAGSAITGAATGVARGLGIDSAAATGPGTLAARGADMSAAGGKDMVKGARRGDEAKYRSYITNSAKSIATDLKKLGMEVSDENQLTQDIQKAITKNLKQVTAGGQFRTQAGQMGAKVV
jgi:hypothetical protein